MSSLREVFSDFMLTHLLPDGRLRIALGTAETAGDLVGLRDGDVVKLVYPGNLEAEATIETEPWQGTRYFYGVVINRDAIKMIDREASAATANSAP